ncbi:MAG: hypothetical protein BMS9Abin15_1010 [Gammaproteobacteria bacterium]|nr:MAG: hypothetical protein BMS9Abin15_1010 [Gammaproteobacteria bacterium]
MRLLRVLLCTGLMVLALPVHALDGFSVDLGRGDESANLVNAALRWNWDTTWFTDGQWFVGGYWEANLGRWNGKNGKNRNGDITEIGITPVFRLQRHAPLDSGMMPFFEGSIGAHLISETSIGNRQLSTAFQLSESLAAGIRFGRKHQMELSYRLQHFSNGGVKSPNSGMNFHMFRFGYNFE